MGLLSDLTGGIINDNGPIIPGVDNPFQSSQTVWLPGAGGLNPLNSQSAVGQLTKDLGALNPYNPDSVAGKVVNNIGKDMAKDPVKWVAIAAAVAAGQFQLIPYINAVATVTSKNSTPEEWLTEGAKAYIISSGGDWVAKNIGGVGPQTDITTGETFAGTGASGATGSAQVGAVAGNISRNIFATAARKGSTDINSAQIVTGAITSEALNEAFKYMPGFENLSKAEQSATVNAFKTAFNKDSNAAYQLFNQGFDATIKGLNKAAQAIGYKDLNQQNAVNNFVQDQGSAEDVEAFNKIEQNAQDKYDNYVAFQEKQKAFNDAQKEYTAAKSQYDYWTDLTTPYPGRKFVRVAAYEDNLNAAAAAMAAAKQKATDNYIQPELVQWAEGEYADAKTKLLDKNQVINTYINQGWDNLAQQKEAAAAGFTDPEKYDSYLTDKKTNADARAEGWADVSQKSEAMAAGYTNPEQYDTYLVDKKADENAVKEGWTSADQKYEAAVFGITSPEGYKNFLTEQTNQRELALAKDNEKNPFTGATSSTVVKEKGLGNYSSDGGGPGGDTDYIPPWLDPSLTGGGGNVSGGEKLETEGPSTVVDTLTKSGLEDTSNVVDLNKVVSGADTAVASTGADTVAGGADTVVAGTGADTVAGGTDTTDDAEQAKRVAEFGKDLTNGGVQDLGAVNTETDFYDENSTGMGAYKYDPTSGTYTYTSDDGSTLTLDGDGNIVGFTEATDTSWDELTDTGTGNLKLPNLPGGKVPLVKPPTKKTTTTTTGTGNTAVTTGSSTVVSTGSGTTVQTGGGLNIPALLAIMGGLGGDQQAQQPQIETYDPSKEFEYFDWSADPFAPQTKEKTNPTAQPKMAGGGSIDELLEILRRSGI